jgi:hypothetical protein
MATRINPVRCVGYGGSYFHTDMTLSNGATFDSKCTLPDAAMTQSDAQLPSVPNLTFAAPQFIVQNLNFSIY